MPTDNLSDVVGRLRAISAYRHPYKGRPHGDEIAETMVPMLHSIADFLEGTRYVMDGGYLEARQFLFTVFASLPRTGLTTTEYKLLHAQLLADACDALREGPHPEALADDVEEGSDTP